MQRLLQRLDRNLKWRLIAPLADFGRCADPDEQQREDRALLQRVARAREAAIGGTPHAVEPVRRFTAEGAWHFVAVDAAGEVAGAVRLHIIDREQEPLEPEDLPRFSHIEFPGPDVRQQHLSALRRLFAEKEADRYFISACGLFTTPPWRGSGLAAVLGVAVVAMGRWYDCKFSTSFTAVRGQAQALFAMLGGSRPLLPDGNAIAPFVCTRHGFEIQLLAFDSRRVELRAEAGVRELAERLGHLMTRQAELA